MQDRFKYRTIVKGYYYNDTPEKYEEFEPLIFLENVDILSIGEIGIAEEDLEIEIRKQYPNLKDADIEYMLENFRDNSNGIDTYITITPEKVYQCTGLKDKNGKLIYEGDLVKNWDNLIYQIFWQEDAACYLVENIRSKNKLGIYSLISYQNNLEIIGNIYENPELLEVEQ